MYAEIKNGICTEIPIGESITKKTFATQKGNWRLCTGFLRNNGRQGEPTTMSKLKKLSDLGLFSEEDFKKHQGNLHKEIGGNDTDAKYIMIYLFNRINECKSYNSDLGYEEENTATEGARLQMVVNRYERDRTIREKVLAKRGGDYSCEVCGFNFEAVYGDLGKNFIHVHHRIPLCVIKGRHQTEDKDFALVCPNCHAMLH